MRRRDLLADSAWTQLSVLGVISPASPADPAASFPGRRGEKGFDAKEASILSGLKRLASVRYCPQKYAFTRARTIGHIWNLILMPNVNYIPDQGGMQETVFFGLPKASFVLIVLVLVPLLSLLYCF